MNGNRLLALGVVAALCALPLGCSSNPASGVDAPQAHPVDAANPLHVDARNDAQGNPPADAAIVLPIDGMPADAVNAFEAPHHAAPQISSEGGSVMNAPKIVPIFFSGDNVVQAQTEGFLTALSGSSYWAAISGEYGVGDLTILPSVVTTDAPPTSDDALGQWLIANADGTHAGWPIPDANTIYAVFLPEGASITLDGEMSCAQFGGYHSEVTTANNFQMVYSLVPRCAESTRFPIEFDHLTVATSHEFLEATTDPNPFSAPAFNLPDDNDLLWYFLPGGELGDMCEFTEKAFSRLLDDTYMVQRTWSNQAAYIGNDPCVPSLGVPYVGAAPLLNQGVTLNIFNQMIPTDGFTVPLGTSAVLEVDLFSDVPADDFTVNVKNMPITSDQTTASDLTFSWDRQTGNNGDKLMLTITRVSEGADGGSGIEIDVSGGTSSGSSWFGFISN